MCIHYIYIYMYTCLPWKRKNIKKSLFCKAKGSASGMEIGFSISSMESGTSRASSANNIVQRHCLKSKHMYIYIYIERERASNAGNILYICIYTHQSAYMNYINRCNTCDVFIWQKKSVSKKTLYTQNNDGAFVVFCATSAGESLFFVGTSNCDGTRYIWKELYTNGYVRCIYEKTKCIM